MKRRAFVLGAVGVAAAATVAGCSSSTTSSTGGGGSSTATTLTVSVPYDNNSFDSADLQGGMELYWGPVYDTLLRHSASDGSIEGNAAQSFSYNTDKTELTLELRSGMTFSDGSAVDAAAVKKSLERLKNGTGASAGYLSSIDTITASDLKLVLALSAPDPVLLDYLTTGAGAIGCPNAFSNSDFKTNPVGSGPYVLDASKSTQGVQYTFTKNTGHWDAASYPYATIVTKVMSDQTARLNALISGQLNFATVDTASLAQAKSSGLTVLTALSGWIGMTIGDRDGAISAPLKDARVRQAINYAFDRDAIVSKIYLGAGQATNSTFDTTNALYSEANESIYSYNTTTAKQLMAAAGYENGFDITLPTSPRSTNLDATIKQSLADIGIKVTYDTYTDEQITPILLKAKYPLYWFGDESQSAFYDIKKSVVPKAVWNPFHSTDAKVEAWVKKAQYATSDDEANTVYKELGTYLIEQGWWVPFTKAPNNFITDKTTTFTPTPTNQVAVFPRNFSPAG